MTDLHFGRDTLDRGSLLAALRALKRGDFSARLPLNATGIEGEIAQAFNDVVEASAALAAEFGRVRRQIGNEGVTGDRIRLTAAGSWGECIEAMNGLIGDLVQPTAEVARVIGSVARGDLAQSMQLTIEGRPLRGEFLRVAQMVNAMVQQLGALADEVSRVTRGDLSRSIELDAQGELAALRDNINQMIRNFKETTRKNTEQDWLKTNLTNFTRMLQGHTDLDAVAKLVLAELAPVVGAQQGVLYLQMQRREEAWLELRAAYACPNEAGLPRVLKRGEGLVGQCAIDGKRVLLREVPGDFVRIGSSLGSARPACAIILPVLFEGEVKAVIELASLQPFNESHLSFLEQLTEIIGVVFNTIEANMRTAGLLAQSQTLTRELQSQQEELKKTNDRLEQQAGNLQRSERLLKGQQDELRRTNEQLEVKARELSEQMGQIEFKNREVEQAKAALEEKAEQLLLSSRYKSEFLANMSHELRTPLNSLLILAKMLADNPASNLSEKQIEYAQTIHAAGADLLSLINDILDLAKIESGTITLNIASERFADLQDYVERTFQQIAHGKGLEFSVQLDSELPATINTDSKRLQQILKNLLSNAFKFTERGKVTLRISQVQSGWTQGHGQLEAAEGVLAFAVRDTGIGIPENKQKVIFEAFQQADGTTSRKYGGTGLGLSISRELTRLLGGEIRVRSKPGKGSLFTLYLPMSHGSSTLVDKALKSVPAPRSLPLDVPQEPMAREQSILDDRFDILPQDRVLMIIEDDSKFARVLLDLARQDGFKGIVAHDGASALELVERYEPDAITLDLRLPDMDGLSLLERLKRDPNRRELTVNVISIDDEVQKCLHLGAIGTVHKPAPAETLREVLARTRKMLDRELKTLLLIDADPVRRGSLGAALQGPSVDVLGVASAKAGIAALARNRYDCVVLGPALGDMGAMDLIKHLAQSDEAHDLPFVLLGGEDGDAADKQVQEKKQALEKLAELVVLKTADSIEGVHLETTRFLNQSIDKLPPRRRRLHAASGAGDISLAGRKVLIVDDDVRNIFAMTAALEQHGLTVINAENGKDGLETLRSEQGIDLVLMDIMMPELDGYDMIRIIRGQEEFARLPIIAVTAKAMKGDREKCIAAGATDYMAKPVNVEQLLSMMKERLAA